MKKLFTSEAVSSGHPDKLCDYISDSILDACLTQDENSRVAVETLVKDEHIVLGGEITTKAVISKEEIIDTALEELHYEYDYQLFDFLKGQSPDIALGTNDDRNGAGDQGIMFGYANTETEEYFPLAISIAHDLIREIESFMSVSSEFNWVKPDMKSQVTIDYSNDLPIVDTVLMSVQTEVGIDIEPASIIVFQNVVIPVLNRYKNISHDFTNIKFLFNPTGKFEIGGPFGDAGVTGRKIVVDSYGGYCPVGGGCFSGKDATKVDRSAAYMARWLAKNIVANLKIDECLVQLSYAIGVSQPVSLRISASQDGYTREDLEIDLRKLEKQIIEHIDLSPKGIIEKFGLKRPLYTKWSRNGSFGVTNKFGVEVPWEVVDKDFLEKIEIKCKGE